MGTNYVESSLKRFLKRKVKVTLGLVVAFMITGTVSFSAVEIGYKGDKITVNGKTEGDITEGKVEGNKWINDKEIKSEVVLNNEILTSGIVLDIENNGIISADDSDNTGNGNGINIFNTAEDGKIGNIINNGIILGNVEGTLTGVEYIGNGIGVFGIENSNISIKDIINSGTISSNIEGTLTGNGNVGNGIGLYSYLNTDISLDNIANDGIISGNAENKLDMFLGSTNMGNGIGFYSLRKINAIKLTSIINEGAISGNVKTIETTKNIALVSIGNGIGFFTFETKESKSLEDIINKGTIVGKVENNFTPVFASIGNGIAYYGVDSGTLSLNNISNSGTIVGNVTGTVQTAYDTFSCIGNGLSICKYDITNKSGETVVNNLNNTGLIIGSENGIYLHDVNMAENFNNYGVVGGKNVVIVEDKDGAEITGKDINYGLYLKFDETDKNIVTEVKSGTGGQAGGYTIINAFETDINDTAKIEEGTINSSDLNSSDNSKLILNGVYNTLTVNEDLKLSDSIINSYKTAVHITEGVFHGNNITVNGGGLDRETLVIKGDEGENTLILEGDSQINGNIDMGTGEDKIFFEKGNMNLYHSISGAEEITFNNNTTLFEETKIEGADNITIGAAGNLILRINSGDNNKHALLENNGTISSIGGKLLFQINGLSAGTEIDMGSTLDDSMKGNTDVEYENELTMDTTSLLHNIEKINNNTVKIAVEKDLPVAPNMPDNLNYEKLNKIYQSIISTSQDGKFIIDQDEKIGEFLAYLNDIYAVNPYAYSSELSRKSMSMFKDSALSKDLMPDVKKWAVYGGLTHVDGGTKDTFYGKGYYTYDIGSRDVEADSKITGAFAQFEYGKSETVKTGFIFGGNNSETEIGASKVEGDSFYFGAFAKKYINDFRFTVGVGFEHGDYKGDRTALGYGITDTRSYSENYHDRGFNIYGDVRYSKDLGNSFYFEPSLNIEYSYVDQDGVSEKGKDLSIETDSRYFDYAAAELNLDVKKIIPMETAKHIFTAGASYERFLTGYDEEFITGRMKDNGTDFDILVSEKEKDNFALNIKYEFEKENGFIFDVKGQYRFEHGNNEKEWIVGTGIGYKF